MKHIIIAGGAGFIGTNLVNRLLQNKEEQQIYVLDNFSSGRYENVNDNTLTFKCDITDKVYLDTIFNEKILPNIKEGDVSEIYNLACPASPPFYQNTPIETTKTCVYGSINLLDIANRLKCKILFTSTSEIYGDPKEHPQKEEYFGNVNPNGIRSCYDEGKRCAESLYFDYNRVFDTDIKIVRIFNTYGPYMRPDDGRVISNFINQIIDNKPITIYGNGQQTRSLCYVDDLVEGLIKMMESDVTGPINMGNPNEMTINEISVIISNAMGIKQSLIEYKDIPMDDPKVRKPDITKASNLLNWEPTISFNEGIIKTINYFKSIR